MKNYRIIDDSQESLNQLRVELYEKAKNINLDTLPDFIKETLNIHTQEPTNDYNRMWGGNYTLYPIKISACLFALYWSINKDLIVTPLQAGFVVREFVRYIDIEVNNCNKEIFGKDISFYKEVFEILDNVENAINQNNFPGVYRKQESQQKLAI
jgi:hypothetical protein